MIKNLFNFFTVLFSFFLLSCAEKKQDSVKIRLNTQKVTAQSVFPTDQRVCYGAHIHGADLELKNHNNCDMPHAIRGGFVKDGDELVLEVPPGVQRYVELYAYLLPVGDTSSPCPDWKPDIDYANVYWVGGTADAVNMESDDVVVEIPVAFPGIGFDLASTLGLGASADGTCAQPPTNPPPVAGPGYEEILTVTAAYSANGSYWMDYIDFAGGDVFAQAGAACSSSGKTSYFGCVHGGEIRKVVLPNDVTSCTSVAASDSLNAFEWECFNNSGTIEIYSTGLRPGIGLRDLLDETGWYYNQVYVDINAIPTYSSPFEVWWQNTVGPVPSSDSAPASLSGVHDIFVVDSTQSSQGLYFQNHKIALVTKYGQTLNHSPVANCDDAGPLAQAGPDYCLLFSDGNDFLWLEGDFYHGAAPVGSQFGFLLGNSEFTKIHNVTMKGFNKGLYLEPSNLTLVNESFFAKNQHGIQLGSSSSYNTFKHVTVSSSISNGIYMLGAQNNVFNEVFLDNNTQYAMNFSGGANNFISNIFMINNGTGVYSDGSGSNTFHHLSAYHNGTGFNMGSDQNTVSNSIFSFNVDYGIRYTTSGTNSLMINIAAPNNNGTGIHIGGSGNTGNDFQGYLIMGSNGTECYNGGGGQGLQNNTCTDSTFSDGNSSYTGHASSAILRVRNIASSFTGPIATQDNYNASSDAMGQAAGNTINDLFYFENPFRAWGDYDASFPKPSGNPRCDLGSSNICNIYDFSILAADSVLRNRSGDPTVDNATFNVGNTCPTEVSGNVTSTDQRGTPITYLTHAYELVGDFQGNENGLCESSETCVYKPQIGTNIGHGYLQPCNFTNGTISNVNMLAHPFY